jgi:hypothetical protein
MMIQKQVKDQLLVATAGLMTALGIVVGTYFMEKPHLLVGLLGGVAFIFMTLRMPELGILTLVAITGGLVNTDWLPRLDFGPLTLHIPDILLAVLLGLVILRSMKLPNHALVRSRLDIPLILFLGAVFISEVNSVIFQDVGLNAAFRVMRKLAYWMVFWIVVQLIRDEKSLRRLLSGLWIFTIILSLRVLLADYLPLHQAILPVTIVTLETAGQTFSGVERFYFPGERILFLMIPISCSVIAMTQSKNINWRVSVLALAVFWLFRSFQRNYWVTIFCSCCLLFYLLSIKQRIRLLRHLSLLMLFTLLIVGLLQGIKPDMVQRQIEAVVERIGSLNETLTRTDSSIQWRVIENWYAIQKFFQHPILGIGIGNSYRPPMEIEIIVGGSTEGWGDSYIHNAYLWIAVMMGLLGLLPFLWLCSTYVYNTIDDFRGIKDDELRGTYLGSGIAFLGAMVSNLVAPNFIQNWSLVIYPVIIGTSEVIYRLSREELQAKP